MAKASVVTSTIPPSSLQRSSKGRRTLREDHPCATAFLDETGAIANDRFFAIGLLKCSEPSVLTRRIQKLRDRAKRYHEIKWCDITRGSASFCRDIVDICVSSRATFYCFIADRASSDPVTRFGNPWDAYTKLAEQLVVAACQPFELMALMADNYSTPDSVLFEQDLRSGVNRRLNRLALVSVVRLDSRSSDGLQAVDLLTSAVAHEFRAAAGLASQSSPKAEVAAHVRSALGAHSCLNGWRNADHSVQIYRH